MKSRDKTVEVYKCHLSLHLSTSEYMHAKEMLSTLSLGFLKVSCVLLPFALGVTCNNE